MLFNFLKASDANKDKLKDQGNLWWVICWHVVIVNYLLLVNYLGCGDGDLDETIWLCLLGRVNRRTYPVYGNDKSGYFVLRFIYAGSVRLEPSRNLNVFFSAPYMFFKGVIYTGSARDDLRSLLWSPS
jgi:hypothetical protein